MGRKGEIDKVLKRNYTNLRGPYQRVLVEGMRGYCESCNCIKCLLRVNKKTKFRNVGISI